MSLLARALFGFPPGTIVTPAMMADRKACLDADPRYSDASIRGLVAIGTETWVVEWGQQRTFCESKGQAKRIAIQMRGRGLSPRVLRNGVDVTAEVCGDA